MTQQQWDQHIDHLQNHVDWPASKSQIIAACSGEDVEASVMDELNNLPSKTYQNETEVKKILVS
ncbi:MAG: DUF2795 domain-containing protein [bacterium]|nr:DUF2795 domain-containing protein [bacterium]